MTECEEGKPLLFNWWDLLILLSWLPSVTLHGKDQEKNKTSWHSHSIVHKHFSLLLLYFFKTLSFLDKPSENSSVEM